MRVVAGLLLLAAAILPAASAQAPRKVALIIANAAYQNASTLANPGNDATLVAHALRQIGFETVVRSDLDWSAMQSALGDFQRSAQGASVAIVYYAGHGVEVGGVNYLIPVSARLDSDTRLRFETVDLDLALGAISGAKLRMIVLDACRDNPFARSLQRSIGTRTTVGAGLASVEERDVFVMFAAASGATATDGTSADGFSPFAKSFARRVTERVEVRIMAGRVRDDVLSATANRQFPYINGSLGGDEYYLTGSVPPPPPVVQASEVEMRSWDAVRQFAAQGDCQVIQDHLQRYAEGATAYLARAALRQCTPREFQLGSRQIQVSAPAMQATAPPTFSLDRLRASDARRLVRADYEATAQRLGVEANALQAIVRVESAGSGFGNDGRPQIVYDPATFSRLTSSRFDATYPDLSRRAWSAESIGGTQEARWSRLHRAFALDAAAALGATSWGVFQQAGFSFAQSGYADVFSFVAELSKGEREQLLAYERYVVAAGAVDEFRQKDWSGLSRLLRGAENPQYANAIRQAYDEQVLIEKGAGYLYTLVAANPLRLTAADFEAAARRLGVETAALQAVVNVQSGSASFGPDGRLIIMFEPHIFSRLTMRRYDASHPSISYRLWDPARYPRTQSERWAQLAEAYALDPQAALSSASYGMFQFLALNHVKMGYSSPQDFVSAIAQSELEQLKAFEAFIRSSSLADELQRLDWEGFTRIYDGMGAVNTMVALYRRAYAEAKAAEQ
ncbi:MAG: DUF3380 domain-containing protein [Hyphomonadaceae bacterium]|nr:DUF3380 domain-containing protein [Hyphomonadaceae bacterium]